MRKNLIYNGILGLAFATLNLNGSVSGDLVTPVGVTASSEWSADHGAAINLINNSGLSEPISASSTHEFVTGGALSMWHAQDGAGGPAVVSEQNLVFDLGGIYDLTSIYVWQMNQAVDPAHILRGVAGFGLEYSTDGGANYLAGPSNLNLAGAPYPGEIISAQTFAFSVAGVTHVRLNIQSAQSGNFLEYVGLSEVKFEGTAIPEPASAMVLGGLGLLALVRRRRG